MKSSACERVVLAGGAAASVRWLGRALPWLSDCRGHGLRFGQGFAIPCGGRVVGEGSAPRGSGSFLAGPRWMKFSFYTSSS